VMEWLKPFTGLFGNMLYGNIHHQVCNTSSTRGWQQNKSKMADTRDSG
jgi:hypothetical protein